MVRQINTETQAEKHPTERVLFLSVREFSARVLITMPFYIAQALPAAGADWSEVVEAANERAAGLLLGAARRGQIGAAAWESVVNSAAEYARGRAYEQFVKVQDRRGNTEGHIVPASLDIWRPGVGVKIDRH